MTVGIGVPFVISLGANPLYMVTLAMTCGYCGTLLTPMAANFNIVPGVYLEVKDKYSYFLGGVQPLCVVETGLPPIQADQLGPVEHIRITRNGQLLFEGGYTAEHDMGWYDLEGNWDPFTMSVSYSSTAGDDYWEHYETDRGTILSFARGPQLVSRGSWELYFAMLLLSALLALDAAFPLVIFHWQHMCDVKDPEPSDFYLGMQRAGWCVYPFLILIGYIIALRALP